MELQILIQEIADTDAFINSEKKDKVQKQSYKIYKNKNKIHQTYQKSYATRCKQQGFAGSVQL